MDSTKASELMVGSNGEVTVKVPHIQVAPLLSVVNVVAFYNWKYLWKTNIAYLNTPEDF